MKKNTTITTTETDNKTGFVTADFNLPTKTDTPTGNELASAIFFDDKLFAKLNQLAEIMSSGACTVPAHLRGNKGDCFAILTQAVQWKMNPFAVAQKTHIINGILGYEAQLVNSVINSMAPTKDRLHYEWFGDWNKVIGKFKWEEGKTGKLYQKPAWAPEDEKGLGVKVWATLKGEDKPRVLELLLSQATVRNSTLWASDPKQQLAYLAAKRWARLYCPDVIMGVYTPDELEEIEVVKNITPTTATNTGSKIEKLADFLGNTQKEDVPKAEVVNITVKDVIDKTGINKDTLTFFFKQRGTISKSLSELNQEQRKWCVNNVGEIKKAIANMKVKNEAPKPEKAPTKEDSKEVKQGNAITEKQRKLFFAKLKEAGVEEDAIKAYLHIDSFTQLTQDNFEDALKAIDIITSPPQEYYEVPETNKNQNNQDDLPF